MSKQVNYNLGKELCAIEFPGLVKDEKKMIRCLGGITNISRAFTGENKTLELRFHPENPFCKPTIGEMVNNCGLLLEITVKRSKKDKLKIPEYSVEIVGYTKGIIKFQNLCDFQFLPIMKQCETQFKFMIPNIVPKNVTDVSVFNKHLDSPLFSIPSNFARSDIVHKRLFRVDIPEDDGNHDTLGVVHKTSFDSRHVVPYSKTEPFPTKADPNIIKRMKVKYVSDEQLEIVKKLFEECPIWTRIALLYESGIKEDKLKCIIPSLAYYFSSGPWRTMYARFGYDPRSDFNSRFYQTFDFRLRFGSGVSDLVLNRQTTMKKKQDGEHHVNDLVHDIYYPYFEGHKLPRSRQVIYRYSDIRIPTVLDLLEKIPSPMSGAVCDEKNGWLPSGFDSQVRQIVSNAIKELLLLNLKKGNLPDDVKIGECCEVDEDEEDEDENFNDVDQNADLQYEDNDTNNDKGEDTADENMELIDTMVEELLEG